jgi:hypothetical protein
VRTLQFVSEIREETKRQGRTYAIKDSGMMAIPVEIA